MATRAKVLSMRINQEQPTPLIGEIDSVHSATSSSKANLLRNLRLTLQDIQKEPERQGNSILTRDVQVS